MTEGKLEIRRGDTPTSVVLCYGEVQFTNVQIIVARNLGHGRLSADCSIDWDPARMQPVQRKTNAHKHFKTEATDSEVSQQRHSPD